MKYLSFRSRSSVSTMFKGRFKGRFKGMSNGVAFLLFGTLSCTVSGYAQSITSLSISPAEPSVVIGGTTQLTATAKYSNGSTSNVSGSATWSSSDFKMVNISSKGMASGLATGTVEITASYEGKSASTSVSSSIGTITWSGPITITKGGTYSGKWKSTSTVPAVTISTTEPVLIENSYVTGLGDLIGDALPGNNLTVKNTIGIGENPNISGVSFGVFVNAQNPVQITVSNCYFENVRFGVYVRGYAGNRNGTETIVIVNNRGRNMLGVESDGNNGTLAGETHWQWSHAFQVSKVSQLPNMRISWNEVVNYPGKSLVNEVINMYISGGTASSPTEIDNNYIQGAYPYNPAVDKYNGGGIITDGTGTDTVANSSSYIKIHNNQIVDTVGVGIEIGNGHNNQAFSNEVISAGLLPNGTRISAQNVGLSIYDLYGNISNGSYYDNSMTGNTVGWMCWASRCAQDGYRNDDYFPYNSADYGANTSIAANPITLAMETAEFHTWLAKLSSGDVVVGPVVSSSGGSGGGGGGTGGGSPSISTTAWYTIVNASSKLCLEAADNGTAAGVALEQNTCKSSDTSQEWQFRKAASSGYYEVVNRAAANAGETNVWDVTGGSWQSANKAPIQMYTSKVETNEEWMPVLESDGDYRFIVESSSKCMDVRSGLSTVLLQMEQYDCNGSAAQSFSLHQQ